MSNKSLKEIQQELLKEIEKGNEKKVKEILLSQPKIKRNLLIITTMKKCIDIDKKNKKKLTKQKNCNKIIKN